MPRWNGRNDEASSVDGVAEEVAVGLVVVAGLLIVRVIAVTVDRWLRHQLMRLLVLVNAVRIEVMGRRSGRSVLLFVMEL